MSTPSVTNVTTGDRSSSAEAECPGDTESTRNVTREMTGKDDIDDSLSSSAKFSEEVWNSWIQDKGVSKE